jgi:hypothetical protein
MFLTMLNNLRRTRISPALVISAVALFASLGGGAYAAVSVTGKDVKNSSLTGKDIKNSSLTGEDVKNGGLTGNDVKNGSIAGADVKGDALGGSQIAESQLGKVPSASTADSAASAGNADTVGGVQVRSFKYRVLTSPAQVVLSLGGLQLTASCGGGLLHFTAQTTVAGGQIDSYSVDPGTAAPPNHNEAIDSGFQIGDDEDNEVGSLRYSKSDGGGVQVSWHAHTAGSGGGCGVNGVATAF